MLTIYKQTKRQREMNERDFYILLKDWLGDREEAQLGKYHLAYTGPQLNPRITARVPVKLSMTFWDRDREIKKHSKKTAQDLLRLIRLERLLESSRDCK